MIRTRATLVAALWAAGLVTILAQGRLAADTPLPPPKTREVWSANRQSCAVMDPGPKTTVVYRVASDGTRTKQWAMPGWFRVGYLADDGEHLVCGHDGINLLPLRVTRDEPMLRFFHRDKLISTVTLGELIEKQSSLKRTASHYLWGHYLGLDEKGRFVVETVEGRKLVFDVATGKTLPSHNDKAGEKAEVYIPKDLDDCFAELKKILSKKDIEKIQKGTEEGMIEYHMGLGMWLRNNWIRRPNSRLGKWFLVKGIHHPDDMSGIILTSFWRHLNGKPVKLEEQIKYYEDYWRKEGRKQEGEEAMSATIKQLTKTDNGKTVKIAVGESFDVVLRGNITTGYEWQIEKIAGDAVVQRGKEKYVTDPHPEGMSGVGGTYTFHFDVKKAAKTKIRLVYIRPWEKGIKPIETFEAVVDSR